MKYSSSLTFDKIFSRSINKIKIISEENKQHDFYLSRKQKVGKIHRKSTSKMCSRQKYKEDELFLNRDTQLFLRDVTFRE